MLEGNLWSEPSPFQEDYFEHVIRDVDSLEKIRDYIRTNSCRPSIYGGSPDVLYHDNGDGIFTNVTKVAKLYQPEGVNQAVQAGD
jgi:hypothetical protein